MATVKTIVAMQMLSAGGIFRGKQGASADDVFTWLNTTVAGTKHERMQTIAFSVPDGDPESVTMYDASQDDLPATWNFLFFWADQAMHLQLIDINATGTNVIIPTLANFPFVMGAGNILAAANETVIPDGLTTLRPIDKIVVGNQSTDTNASAILCLID